MSQSNIPPTKSSSGRGGASTATVVLIAVGTLLLHIAFVSMHPLRGGDLRLAVGSGNRGSYHHNLEILSRDAVAPPIADALSMPDATNSSVPAAVAGVASSYLDHLDPKLLQTPQMFAAMQSACPADRRIRIGDGTDYFTFIDRTFAVLNKVVVGKRPIDWIFNQAAQLWGDRAINSTNDGRGALPGGFYAEFGVFQGKTLSKARALLKPSDPNATHFFGPIAGFDSFMGLPEKWRDGFDAGRFGRQGLYEYVRSQIPSDVSLHKGWFQETIAGFLAERPGMPAAFIHHDGDLFISTAITFSLLDRRIVPGTIVCFDELHSYDGWEKHEMLSFYLWMVQTGAEVCALATKAPLRYRGVVNGVPTLDWKDLGPGADTRESSCFQITDRSFGTFAKSQTNLTNHTAIN